jgi:ATP-dependent Lon protease
MAKSKVSILTIPFLPLRGTFVFPHTVLHIDVGRGRSVASVNSAMNADQRIFLIMQKNEEKEDPATSIRRAPLRASSRCCTCLATTCGY